MDYKTGKCEDKSKHEEAKIKHLTIKKYIIQRWYYYENFHNSEQRKLEAKLPKRPLNTPKVSCVDYDSGGCRLYDEWNSDHLNDS